ncbi:hypothetical protein [Herbidospora cretacea]|nr:hypothetical protein [Herbidospora cretacea]
MAYFVQHDVDTKYTCGTRRDEDVIRFMGSDPQSAGHASYLNGQVVQV